MADENRLLGEDLTYEDRLALAQLVHQPGWKILVRLMAQACRKAIEEVIRLDPCTERHDQKLTALQATARAMNKFSADVLDSVKAHQRQAVQEAQQRENPTVEVQQPGRFRFPAVESPKGQ